MGTLIKICLDRTGKPQLHHSWVSPKTHIAWHPHIWLGKNLFCSLSEPDNVYSFTNRLQI